MSIGDLLGAGTLVATILGAVVVVLRMRGEFVLVSPDVIAKLNSALTNVQNQNTVLSDELDEERQKRRELERRTSSLERDHKNQQNELEETKRLLTLYRENIDTLLEWVNMYTPALRKAGIEPPDIENMQFRG